MSALSTRFAGNRYELNSQQPLSNDAIRRVAPSIFGAEAHRSRSTRYSYIPTGDILGGLRKEGFQPFMVAQCRSRDASRKEFTKHMLRLRHASQITARAEVPEIILINSHDGTSSYQMLAGTFRFVCANGMVCGNLIDDIRIPHKGNVSGEVIEGAYKVLGQFETVENSIEAMKAETLSEGEQLAMARAALALRYEEGRAPVSEDQILDLQRREDNRNDLWTVFNRVQENLIRGGQWGRSPASRRNVTTRAITGIDQGVKLNRALWILAEEMQKLRRH